MPQSLKATDFDYTDELIWGSYFNTQIQKFIEKAHVLDEFHQELIRKCDGLPFDELQEEWDYSSVLLGGVNKKGEYRERSLAKLYKELFGFQFEDLKEVIEKQRQDISPSTKVVVGETPFTNFVSGASDKAGSVLHQAHENDIIYEPDVETDYDFYDLLSDQENLSQLLRDFVYQLQDILPNYNEKSLFIWTLDKTPHRYLSVAYPKLKDEKSWEELNDTFGLEKVFVPNIDENGNEVVEREQQYTVYDYREGSLSDTLNELYRLVWDAFDGGVRESLRLVFPEIPNFKQEFIEEAHDKLNQIGWNNPNRLTFELSEEESLRLVGNDNKYSSNQGNNERAVYQISGITLSQCDYAGYSTNGNLRKRSEECNLSLLRVLDQLSPGLFLLNRLEYELHINQGSLEVEKL